MCDYAVAAGLYDRCRGRRLTRLLRLEDENDSSGDTCQVIHRRCWRPTAVQSEIETAAAAFRYGVVVERLLAIIVKGTELSPRQRLLRPAWAGCAAEKPTVGGGVAMLRSRYRRSKVTGMAKETANGHGSSLG